MADFSSSDKTTNHVHRQYAARLFQQALMFDPLGALLKTCVNQVGAGRTTRSSSFITFSLPPTTSLVRSSNQNFLPPISKTAGPISPKPVLHSTRLIFLLSDSGATSNCS